MKIYFNCVVFIFVSLLFSNQDIDVLIEEVLIGNRKNAELKLSHLISTYPNDPNVMYLNGLLIVDGKESIAIYKKIISNHHTHKYADDAVMRIGEYYYAVGSYIQAALWLKKIPKMYPHSEHLSRGSNLFLNCLIVVGSIDSAQFYSKVFLQLPKFKLDKELDNSISEYKKDKNKINVKKEKQKSMVNNTTTSYYTVQLGSFTYRKNAKIMLDNLRDGGFNECRIDEIFNRKILFNVRCGKFETQKNAKRYSKKIILQIGYDSIIKEI